MLAKNFRVEMWQHIMILVGMLVTNAHAFSPAPIQWGGLPSWRIVSLSTSETFMSRDPIPSLSLIIGDPMDNMLPNRIPYFTAKPDKTIAWDAMGFCLEASGVSIGDVARVSKCTGGPTQRWSWYPWGQIQLQGTNKCLDVTDNSNGFTGAPIALRECGHTATASWKFDDPDAFVAHGPSPRSKHAPPLRYVMMISVITVAIGALGLSLWFRRWQEKSHAVTASQHGLLGNLEHGEIHLSRAITQSPPPSHRELWFARRSDVSMNLVEDVPLSRRSLLAALPAAILLPRTPWNLPLSSKSAAAAELTDSSEPEPVQRLLALCEGRRPSSWTPEEIESTGIDSLIEQVAALQAPWPREALTGKWKLAYLQPGPGGAGVDRRIPFPEFDFNDSFQQFDIDAGTVVNIGEVLGPSLVVRVGGTLAEEDQSVKAAPKRFRASIDRGELCARDGPCLPLPISGEGLFDGIYLGKRLRIGQNLNGGGARIVQVRVE